MWIEQVRLQNIKSYCDCTIHLHQGVNFVSGHNGAGKSTLIEAIGLALFGATEGTYAQLLRWGAKSGAVEVTFHTAQGDFRVERKLTARGSGAWTAHEVPGGQIALHDDADMSAWLREVLGLEDAGSLADHFRDLVAVRQGTFAAPFLDAPQRRKTYFDPLFDIESFRQASDRARAPEKVLEERAKATELRCVQAQTRAEGIPELQAQQTLAQQAVSADQQAHEQAAAVYARMADRWKRRIDLEKQVIKLQAEQRTLAEQTEKCTQAQAQATQEHAQAQVQLGLEREKLPPLQQAVGQAAAAAQQCQEQDGQLRALRERYSGYKATKDAILRSRDQAAGGLCPYLGEPCRTVEGGLAGHFAREIAQVDAKMQEVTVRAQALVQVMAGLDTPPTGENTARLAQEAVARAQQAQRAAEKAVDAQQQSIRRVQEDMQRLDKRLAELSGEAEQAARRGLSVQNRLSETQAELDALAQPEQGEQAAGEAPEVALQAAGLRAAQAKSKWEQGLQEYRRIAEQLHVKLAAEAQALQEQKALQEVQNGLEVMGLLRQVLGGAGERIATVLRGQIAIEAERLYQRIAQENVSLAWSDGYEVQLIDQQDGTERRRGFAQLSGGERMSAALAVRLALLLQFSPLRFACFDEPTDALDAERRANLSQVLPELTRQWDQVLIISHDDTFDAITENVLQLSGGRDGTQIL